MRHKRKDRQGKSRKVKTPVVATLLTLCISLSTAMGQSSVNAAGGNASGSGGSVSYSVGQVVYQYYTGTNGAVAEGVQQLYDLAALSLNIRVFIEGLYLGGSTMTPVFYNNGLSLNPNECDSITIELRDPLSPSSILFTQNAMLLTNGYTNVPLPSPLLGNSYFIVVKHRNSIETWSKTPTVILNGTTLFDFTQ